MIVINLLVQYTYNNCWHGLKLQNILTIHIPEYKHYIRQPRNKVKDYITAQTLLCLLFLYLGFSFPTHVSAAHSCGCNPTLVTKFVCALGTTVVLLLFCRLCTNPSGYNIGCYRSHSIMSSSLRLEILN